jgi:hypothetical protein
VDAVVDRLSREGKAAPALSPTLEFIA